MGLITSYYLYLINIYIYIYTIGLRESLLIAARYGLEYHGDDGDAVAPENIHFIPSIKTEDEYEIPLDSIQLNDDVQGINNGSAALTSPYPVSIIDKLNDGVIPIKKRPLLKQSSSSKILSSMTSPNGNNRVTPSGKRIALKSPGPPNGRNFFGEEPVTPANRKKTLAEIKPLFSDKNMLTSKGNSECVSVKACERCHNENTVKKFKR